MLKKVLVGFYLFQVCMYICNISYSGFLSRGINNRVRWYVAVLKSAVFNAPLLIVTWEIVKTACHYRRMSLWDYFKRKGPLSDPKGSLARIIPSSAIAEFSFTWQNPIIAEDVSITLAPWPSTMASQAGLLNSAYFSV